MQAKPFLDSSKRLCSSRNSFLYQIADLLLSLTPAADGIGQAPNGQARSGVCVLQDFQLDVVHSVCPRVRPRELFFQISDALEGHFKPPRKVVRRGNVLYASEGLSVPYSPIEYMLRQQPASARR